MTDTNEREQPTLRTFRASFTGRTKGAIGVFQKFLNVMVTAIDADAARIALYDTHEHITNLKLTEVETKGTEQ